jgi:hypothetical protein
MAPAMAMMVGGMVDRMMIYVVSDDRASDSTHNCPDRPSDHRTADRSGDGAVARAVLGRDSAAGASDRQRRADRCDPELVHWPSP